MTEAERRRRLDELRERSRRTRDLMEREDADTARVLALIDRALAKLAAAR